MRRFTFWLYAFMAAFSTLAAGFLASRGASPWTAVLSALFALFVAWLAAERRPRR